MAEQNGTGASENGVGAELTELTEVLGSVDRIFDDIRQVTSCKIGRDSLIDRLGELAGAISSTGGNSDIVARADDALARLLAIQAALPESTTTTTVTSTATGTDASVPIPDARRAVASSAVGGDDGDVGKKRRTFAAVVKGQSTKALASASAGCTRNSISSTKQQGKSNTNSSPAKKTDAKNSKMISSASSAAVAADPPSPSPSSGGDGVIIPPKAKATSTTTVTSTNLVAVSMEGKQIEEPSPSSSDRGYDRESVGCPKANRVHTLVNRIGKVSSITLHKLRGGAGHGHTYLQY